MMGRMMNGGGVGAWAWWRVAVGCVAVVLAGSVALGQPRARVASVDNRGRILVDFDRDMRPDGFLNQQSVTVTAAGADGISGTGDDVVVSRTAVLDPQTLRRLTIVAQTDPDERYEVVVRSSFARDLQGVELDGEFNGAGSLSGNGQAGGDLVFFARPTAGNPVARMETVSGTIDVELFADQTPLTVQNFFDYANDGVWDSTFIHRQIAGFIVQGGGYNTLTFQRIPQSAPVPNEPGISNLRGTIAMAKLPNQPNSATNEWFFNLANNSSNLDNQNGGFTVFGEVVDSAGLGVMDDLAAFPKVNASQINGAFTDLPVVDDVRFLDENGNPIPNPDVRANDLVFISRISILFEAVDRPFRSIEPEQSATLFGPNGSTAEVRLFNLDGGAVTLPEAIADVRFGSGNSISSITFREPFSASRIGVQVSGASSVGAIRDTRSAGNDRLAFVICDAPVGSIRLNSLSGFDINGTRLPDGTILPADIDGDGRTDDPTALILSGATINQVHVTGDVTGSAVFEDGVRQVRVDGWTRDCSFVVLGPTTILPAFALGRVVDSSIDAAANGLSQVSAVEWVGGAGQRIDALGVRSLRVTGRASEGVRGDFHASLFLTGLPGSAPVLVSALVNGDVRDSSWDLFGNAGSINIRGAASQWTLRVNQFNLNSLVAGRLAAATVASSGFINQIVAGEWNAGNLVANRLRQLVVRPNAAAQGNGTFEANIVFSGSGSQPFSIGTLQFLGPVRNATMNIPFSHSAQRVIFTKDIENSQLTLNGSIGDFRALGEIRSSSLVMPQTQTITIGRWQGGSLNAGNSEIRTLRTVGVGQQPGDLRADVTARSIQTMRVGRGGSYTGVLDVDLPGVVIVEGDLVDAVLRLGAANLRGFVINQRITVLGEIRTSRIQATGALGQVRGRGLVDSQVLTGPANVLNGVQTIPDTNPGLFGVDRIEAVVIEGAGARVERSFVVAGSIGGVAMNGVVTGNNGAPIGVATGSLDSLRVATDGGLVRFFTQPLSSPRAWGDFQVRVGFQIPTEQSP